MKYRSILTILLMAIGHFSFSQGSIDIDTNIQMGVVGTEHVKITSSAFSVHNGAGGIPLIFGDFGTGNVGIGTSSPNFQLEIHSSNIPSLSIGTPNVETGGQSKLIFHAGSGIYKNGFGVYYNKNSATDRLGFVDGGAVEILSLVNGGKVGIGTTSPQQALDVTGNANISGELIIPQNAIVRIGNNHSNHNYLRIITSTTSGSASGLKAGGVLVADSYAYSNPGRNDLVVKGIIYYNTLSQLSDKRLKKNITALPNSIDKLKKISGVEYDWIENDDHNMGLLAQDVEKVYPDLIHEIELGKEGSEEKQKYKTVNYTGLIAPMIEAIKSLSETVDRQAIEIAELQNQMNTPKKK